MDWHTIGLITLFHPERYIGCDSSDLRNHNHTLRYRAKRTEIAKSTGLLLKPKYIEDHLIHANGNEIEVYKDNWIHGRTIVEYLPEPRLIRIPDEAPGRPKWRIEFRRQWPIEDPLLHPSTERLLKDSLRSSFIRIKGVWINPSVDPEWPNAHWVNLVLGPCSSEHKNKHSHVELKFRLDKLCGLQIFL